jgi:hypothetical protein
MILQYPKVYENDGMRVSYIVKKQINKHEIN